MTVTTRDTLKLPVRKARKAALIADAPIPPLFQQFILKEFQHARLHEKGIIRDDNLEFLHQYRVSLRRTRSLMKQLKYLCPKKHYPTLNIHFKTLMAHTNQLRDLDVYLQKMDDYFDCLDHIHHQGLARFFDDLQDARKGSYKTLKRWLKSDEYQQQNQRIEKQLTSKWYSGFQADNASPSLKQISCKEAAKQAITASYQEIRQYCDAINNDSDDSQIHQLRIACKQLRYCLEYFSPLLKRNALTVELTLLKTLQDNLGDFNDASVQLQFLLSYRANKKPSSHRYRAISELINITEHQHDKSRKRIIKQLSAFNLALEQKTPLFR
ncbi:CHAD domain-containing protein [Photobacterium sanguinicancri]|uniref:CHAD domain-containing protein n=1 Tax=Photobacterium sanguinicancri TaxID=875932 RepID=UPI0021C2CD3F|nr:CHAD domain-containing protein [Photobacterium sanguinicancri]